MSKYADPAILDDLDKIWKGKTVQITNQSHPHRNKIGVVEGQEYFPDFGFALIVNINSYIRKCRVFSDSKNKVTFNIKIIE